MMNEKENYIEFIEPEGPEVTTGRTIPIKPEGTIDKKGKNPKRVLAGKKAAEARKVKNEQKKKEYEKMEKENMKLKLSSDKQSITKDDSDDDDSPVSQINVYKNYLPLCLIGIIGIGVIAYTSKNRENIQRQLPVYTSPTTYETSPQVKPTTHKKEEFDPFEFK